MAVFHYPEGYVEHMEALCESLGISTDNMTAAPHWELDDDSLRFKPTYYFDVKKLTAEQREAFEKMTGIRWKL